MIPPEAKGKLFVVESENPIVVKGPYLENESFNIGVEQPEHGLLWPLYCVICRNTGMLCHCRSFIGIIP